jgi:hypothetical protein
VFALVLGHQTAPLRKDAERIRNSTVRGGVVAVLQSVMDSPVGTFIAALNRSENDFLSSFSVSAMVRSSEASEKLMPDSDASKNASWAPISDAEAGFQGTRKPEEKQKAPEKQLVYLFGDSLMGGLGPAIANRLRDQHDLVIKNLSKQNSGLSYPSFFNWPKQIRKKIGEKKPAAVIVMLGANDPWDMAVRQKFVPFGSPEWMEEYAARVHEIMSFCMENGVPIAWVGMPPMRKDKFDRQVTVCNRIYEEEAKKTGALYVSSRDILTGGDGLYTKFLANEKGGRAVARADDGIHFSAYGADRLADYVLRSMKESGMLPSEKIETKNL